MSMSMSMRLDWIGLDYRLEDYIRTLGVELGWVGLDE